MSVAFATLFILFYIGWKEDIKRLLLFGATRSCAKTLPSFKSGYTTALGLMINNSWIYTKSNG